MPGGPFLHSPVSSPLLLHSPLTRGAHQSNLSQSAVGWPTHKDAAEACTLQSGSPISTEEAVELITSLSLVFAVTPVNMEPLAVFMQSVGTIGEAPRSWRDVFFPLPGEDAVGSRTHNPAPRKREGAIGSIISNG